ncbi:hypothetical protein ACEWY4_021158 [Coilia grayii]|uniref:G-protein coupled receptors family 1 profile domain-containing protein n=1 Tax=Coilia grayii TaxID=363190 RepID=A0ABD1JAP2_9TELE
MEQFDNSLSNSTAANLARVQQILGWVTFAVGLPAVLLSIYMLTQLVRAGNGTPVQAINLLISDIFNLLTRPQTPSLSPGSSTLSLDTDIPSLIFYFGVASNIVFMVGMAQERHLRVASQRCHGCCRRAKQSSVISLAIWAAPVGLVVLLYLGYRTAFLVCLLLPFPLLLFFFLDSCRALLCCSTSVTLSERRRVLAMLVAILANYTILFLPFALTTLLATLEVHIAEFVYFGLVANMLLYLSPVINPFLSLLLTKSLRELLDTFPCCRRRGGTFDTTEETNTHSPVVFENLSVTLPLPTTGNCGPLASGSTSVFPPKGMDTAPNGISTIFGNFSTAPGMPSMFPQVPSPVSGGLAAAPNGGAACGQVPVTFGNPMTLPMMPLDPDTTSTESEVTTRL